MREIRAAVIDKPGGTFGLKDLFLDDPRPDEILIEIVACGVCHTDLVLRDRATGPIVLGHEGAGVVVEVGSAVRTVAPGDKVLVSFNSCGTCQNCLREKPAYCYEFNSYNVGGTRNDGSFPLHDLDGTSIKGNFFGQSSFASHVLARERNTVRLPKETPMDMLPILAPLGCGFQTGAGAVLNSLEGRAGNSLVIFGAGSVGLAAVMAARIKGIEQVIAVDLLEERLALARQLGATHSFLGTDPDLVDKIKAVSGGGADSSIDTTGNKGVVRNATEVLHPGGTAVLLGVGSGEVSFDHSHILRGICIMGVYEGDSVPQTFIPQLIELYKRGQFPIDKLITKYPFDNIQQAAEDSETGETIKAVVAF